MRAIMNAWKIRKQEFLDPMMHQLKQFICCKITFKNHVLRHVAMY